MAKLRLDETVPVATGVMVVGPLGVDAANTLTDKDKGKAVKRGASGRNWILAADGNDLEGRLESLEVGTVNDGFNHGTIRRGVSGIYMKVVNADAGALAVGATIVCAAQSAVGTVQTVAPYPKVKAGAGVLFKWRIVELYEGAGAVGSVMLAERI